MKTIVLALLLVGLLIGCAGGPAPGGSPSTPGSSSSASGQPISADSLAKMRELLESGLDRKDQGLYSDAIKQLVSVLAERESAGGSSREADEIATLAETELAKLGSSMALEADSPWFDNQGNQMSAKTLDLGLLPSVILTVKQETGRSLVSNAPIQFSFVEGNGVLTAMVNTNDFGQANCAIASFDNPQAEQVVRAALVYKVRDFTYAFKGVARDFVYRPPLQRASILVMEKSALGVASDPFIVDPVFQELKAIDFDFSLYNAVLSPDDFLRVYEGNLNSISAMSLEENVSYLVVLLSDCYDIRQLELGGKKYNLYVADARATLRIVRKADGKILYQKAVERAHANGLHGQGGTESKAAQDVFRKIAQDMAGGIKTDLAAVTAALRGE